MDQPTRLSSGFRRRWRWKTRPFSLPPALSSGADGGGEDAAELDRYPVGLGVQLGGDVERELQAGQGPPLQVQVLLEDRHLVLGEAFRLFRVGQARPGHGLVQRAGPLVFWLRGEGEEIPPVRVEELQQQGRGQRSLVPVGHPAALHRLPGTVTHRRVGEVGERVLPDGRERKAATFDVGPRDRLRPGAADRGRVDEREVRLVEEVVDQDRRVSLHPQDREERRRHAVAAERHARMKFRDGGARRLRGQPHQAVLLGDLGRAAQRGPLRDGRVVLERRDVHAPARVGEPPAVVCALQGSVDDLPGGQARPAVRAGVGERRDAPVEAGQGPALAADPDRDRLQARLPRTAPRDARTARAPDARW